MNILSFLLLFFWESINFSLFLKDNFVDRVRLLIFFSFSTLNILLYYFLAYEVSAEKSPESLTEVFCKL